MDLDDGTFSAVVEESVFTNDSLNRNEELSFDWTSQSYNKIYYNFIKFIEDYLLSSILLLLIFPLMLLIAIAIKLTSSGPVFYRQTRVGKNGKRFRIFKFN